MEEDIKILEEMIRLNKKRIAPQIVQAIENLINKYKELEADIYSANCIINEYIESDKEQGKMIELMLIDLSKIAFYKDDIIDYCEVKKQECEETADVECKNCLLEYYKKKAREENEIN